MFDHVQAVLFVAMMLEDRHYFRGELLVKTSVMIDSSSMDVLVASRRYIMPSLSTV